jgi:transposase
MAGYVGLDVGARTVVMAWRNAGRVQERASFVQTAQGHAELIARLKRLQPQAIVMEATGIYYLDLAVALVEAGLEVSVINPRSARHFAQIKLAQSKTDAIDAALLAEYAERMSPSPWVPPQPTQMGLRDLARQINRLTATRTQAKNRLHALCAKSGTLALLIEDEREAIDALDRRIERLTQAAQQLLSQAPELERQLQIRTSAKGIGTSSAIALLGELCVLPRHLKAAQVSRFAGLDVRLCQSGSSINKPGRLSKAGNAYLRSALYMPALSAVRHDPRARDFYAALQRRGKKKMQALCAVMRKYLTGIWACLQHGENFDSSKLFSDIHSCSA